MANIDNSTDGHAIHDALSFLAVRELCHDLLESAATIRLLAQAVNAEADPTIAPGSQLPSQLRLITTAASQIAAICAQVLDQCNPPATPVIMTQVDPSMIIPPQVARHKGGPSR